MAGISIKQIQDNLSANFNIIRAMTNLTVSNGEAIIFYYNKTPFKKNIMKAEAFFKTFSKIKKCKSEDQLDKLTALYGSGPAYYIFFNSIIKRSFEQMGFNKKESDSYTHSLMLDSSELLGISDSQDLLRAIASKGGTTEAALSQLKKDKVDLSVRRAVQQAYKKSKKILSK